MKYSPSHKPTDSAILLDVNDVFKPFVDPVRTILERTWFRNILYYLGEQWLSWFESRNTFGRRSEINVNIPTPVSNMVRDYVKSTVALTTNKNFATTVWPNSREQSDKDAAKLAELVIRWLDTINDNEAEDIKELTEFWRTICGNAFVRVFPDNDPGKYVIGNAGEIIPAPPECAIEVVIPFNVEVDSLGLLLRDKAYIGIKSLKSKAWVEAKHDIELKGTESLAEVEYQKQLMTLVSNVSPWKGRGFDTSNLEINSLQLVVYKEMEFKPTKEYPKGRYTVTVGDQVIVNKAEMPIPVAKDGSWYYTLTHFVFNNTPGSFWGTGGVDDLISPQNTVNEIDQAMSTNRRSLGRPWVLTPAALSLKRISARGQALLALEYNHKSAGGAKPEVQPGTPYPSQILDERKIHKEVAQEAAGDPKNVLRGQTPGSGASGVMVDILRETAEQSHTPDIKRFYRAWNRVQKKRLIIVQDITKVTQLIKIPGEGNEILIRNFKGADLRNNTDVKLELDSGSSTTNAGRNQFLMTLIEQGFWGEMSEHPEIRRELLRRMGMSGFPEVENIHRDRAEYENSLIAAGNVTNIALPNMPLKDADGTVVQDEDGEDMLMFPDSFDPVFRLDNHPVHMQVLDVLIFSREFLKFSEERQTYAIAHRDMHEQAMKIQVQEQLRDQMRLEQGIAAEAEAMSPQPGLSEEDLPTEPGPSVGPEGIPAGLGTGGGGGVA